MKSKAVTLLLITGLTVSLAGCRGAESTNGTDGNGKGSSEVTQDTSNSAEQDTQPADENTGSGETPEDGSENGEDISASEGKDTDTASDIQAGMKDSDELRALCITGSNNYLSEWLEAEQKTLYNIQYQKIYLEQEEVSGQIQDAEDAAQKQDANEPDQKEMSALSDVLTSYNEKMSADMKANAEELRRTSQEALDNGMLDAAYTITQRYQIVRADESVFSAWSKTDSYTGGAHPFYIYDGITLDVATGKELSLSDVVTDTAAMAKQLAAQLAESYDDNAFSDLALTLQSMLKSNTLEWTLGNEGLEFCFAPGNLAPYAVGVVSTIIPYDKMPELFNEKYIATCNAYTRAILLGNAEKIDINGDGEPEEILLTRDFGEYGEADGISTGIRVQIDSGAYSFESPAYDYTCYLVHSDTDKWYLYVDGLSDNDYHTLQILDLNNGTPEQIAIMYGTGFYKQYLETDEGYDYLQDFFTNPEEFRLDVRTDLLSTILAFRSYRLGPDGNPEAKQEYYYFDTDRKLTSKIDLELEFPETGKKETVPAGSEFGFYRTDNENFVDMKLDDGRICRVTVDNSDWPAQINGKEREEVFSGMVFAG